MNCSDRQPAFVSILAALSCLLVVVAVPASAAWWNDVLFAEFAVNLESTTNDQSHATMALDSGANQTATWESVTALGPLNVDSLHSIFTAADGNGDGAPDPVLFGGPGDTEKMIHDSSSNLQRTPDTESSREVLPENEVMVHVWAEGTESMDSATYDVYARIFDATGNIVGPAAAIKVNTQVSEARAWPDVDVVRCDPGECDPGIPNGSFVVVWTHWEIDSGNNVAHIMARAFDPLGNALSGAIQLDQTFSLPPFNFPPPFTITPDVAVNATGDAIAAWDRVDFNPQTPEIDVAVREFNAFAGTFLTNDELIAPVTDWDQQRPMVDYTDMGDAVITWVEWPELNHKLSLTRSYFTRKLAGGNWEAVEHVSVDNPPQSEPFGQLLPVVRFVHGQADRILLAWTKLGDIVMREIDYVIQPLGNNPVEQTVNDRTSGWQIRPAFDLVNFGGETRIAVAWESVREVRGDPDGWDIFSKIYSTTDF